MQRKTQTVPRKEKAAYCKIQMSEQKELQDLKATKFGETSTDMIFALTEALKCRELPLETVTLIRAVLEKAGIKPRMENDGVILYVNPQCSCGSEKVILNRGAILTADGADIPVYSLCCENCLRFTGPCSSASDLVDQWIEFERGSFLCTRQKNEYTLGFSILCPLCGEAELELLRDKDGDYFMRHYYQCPKCGQVVPAGRDLSADSGVANKLLLELSENTGKSLIALKCKSGLLEIRTGGYGG